jgi:hypothetical protein
MSGKPSNAGQGVDAQGGPVVDPTANVIALNEAANRRQDDLRAALEQRFGDTVGLKEYFLAIVTAYDKRYEQRFDASQKALEAALTAQKAAIDAAMASAERAVLKAEIAAEKRFEALNQQVLEFRGQLADQQRTLMPRAEAENRLAAMADKIGVLEGFRTEMLSKGIAKKEGYGVAVGIVGLVLTILSIASIVIVVLSRLSPT